jgi:hypothetical protein
MNTNESYLIQDNQKISGYTVKETTHQEKKHLVVPVTMIVEGVLNGSNGPLLHLAQDFGKFPEAWNGIPVVINHPEVNGMNVSANSPEVIEAGKVGTIYNSRIENNALKAEVWLEEAKLALVSPDCLSAIGLKQSIEVSVGVFTEYESTPGTYNGVEYTAIARNHRPDHLALLPGGIGACSIADGCGIRVNSKKKGESNDMLNVTHEQRQQFQQMKYSVIGIVDNSSSGLKEKLEELRNLVNSLDVPSTGEEVGGVYHYLEEAYDTYLIYEKYDGKGESKYYKQNYQFNVDGGEAAFVGDPIEVEKKIEYEAVMQTNNLLIRTKNIKTKSMENEKCTPCVKAKVDALIANAASKFTEEDRSVLETLSENVLDRMIPEAPKEIQVNLSAADQAALDFGRLQLKERRDARIATITANTAEGIWTPEILANMDDDTLERVAKSTKPKAVAVDYSGNAGGTLQANTGKEAPMLPNV